MLSKILLTLFVIIAVVIYLRHQNQNNQKKQIKTESSEDSVSPQNLAYIIVAILLFAAVSLFAFEYHQNNQLLALTVTDKNGNKTQFNVKQKNYNGRSFTTVEGLEVNLGADDRLEISKP